MIKPVGRGHRQHRFIRGGIQHCAAIVARSRHDQRTAITRIIDGIAQSLCWRMLITINTAHDVADLGWDATTGWGRIDAYVAVQSVALRHRLFLPLMIDQTYELR